MSANGQRETLSPERLGALCGACLLIDDARIHGLIDAGPEIDREKCSALLRSLRRDGIIPSPDEVSEAALSLMAEIGVVRE